MRRLLAVLFIGLSLLSAASAAPPTTCSTAQVQFDRVIENPSYGTSWNTVQEYFGPPHTAEEGKPSQNVTQLSYTYPGCQLSFIIGPSGKVTYKRFKLGAAALLPAGAVVGSAAPANGDLTSSINSLQATATQLRAQLDRLELAISELKGASSAGALPSSPPPTGLSVSPGAATAVSTPLLGQPVPTPRTATTVPPSSSVGCAENGSCYGDISAATGKPKTVQVNGYYRKDGTYVRGHMRSK